MGLKLFGREIILEECQPMRSRYLNVTDRGTDGQTDRQTIYRGITALCVASRGKNGSRKAERDIMRTNGE